MPKTYHVELSLAAKRDLKRLPRSIQKEKAFINEPKEERSNVKSVGPKPNPTRWTRPMKKFKNQDPRCHQKYIGSHDEVY